MSQSSGMLVGMNASEIRRDWIASLLTAESKVDTTLWAELCARPGPKVSFSRLVKDLRELERLGRAERVAPGRWRAAEVALLEVH